MMRLFCSSLDAIKLDMHGKGFTFVLIMVLNVITMWHILLAEQSYVTQATFKSIVKCKVEYVMQMSCHFHVINIISDNCGSTG